MLLFAIEWTSTHFAVLKIRYDLEKYAAATFVEFCIPPKIKTIFNHVVLRGRNSEAFELVDSLTHPFAKTVWNEAIFVNKKSQSAKAKDFAVSAQMRREARTRETEGTLVKV